MNSVILSAARIEVRVAAKHLAAAAATKCPQAAAMHMRVAAGVMADLRELLDETSTTGMLAAAGIVPLSAVAPAFAVELATA